MDFFSQTTPMHGAGLATDYPGEWDDKQAMAACSLIFTPATGTFTGKRTAFLYYRGTDDLLSGAGVVSIGVMTADPESLNGLNWNKQRAINPIILPDADLSAPVFGGDYNDMIAVEYDGAIRLFVNIYANPAGSNRMVVFESNDGLTFNYLQEVQHGGTYFGCTCGPMWNVSGTLWGLFSQSASTGGNKKRLRSSADGGLTWTDHGTAIELSTDPKAWDSHSLVVGRPIAWESGDTYVYALIPGMRYIGLDGSGDPHSDWPEAIGLYRCAVADLGTADTWERYPRPVMMRGPLDGGIWQLAPLRLGGSLIGTYQAWSMIGDDNIASANMTDLRDTPYAGLSAGWSTKHIKTAFLGSRLALDDWDYDPLPAGDYHLRHVATGSYMAEDAGFAETSSLAPTTFTLSKEGGFCVLTLKGTSTRLRSSTLNNGAQVEISADDLGADPLNLTAHWLVQMREDQPGQPPLIWLVNRHSSLGLSIRLGADREGVAIEQRPFVGSAAMLFELVSRINAGDTTEVIAPPLPSTDVVRVDWEQTVTNKAIEVLPRNEAVSRNLLGDFDLWANGTKLLTDAGIFTRLASSSAISDFAGFVPWVGYRIVDAKTFFADEDSPDDQAAKFQAMVNWASGLNRPVVLDCSGMTFRFGVGIVPQGATDVQILHGTYKPHENWTSQAHWSGGPPTKIVWNSKTTEPDADAKAVNALFDLSPGVGRIQLYGCTFDGRPDSGAYDGVAVADHVAMRAGTNNVIWCEGRYFYDYGIWNSGGNAQKISYCTFEQWKFNDAGNQVHANRTGAAYAIASGDCEVEFCLGGYTAYPLVAIGTVGHMRFNHFYNGVPDASTGTVTTNRQYCVLARSGAGLSMQNCQLDKGGIHFQGKVASVVRDCEIHLDSNWDGQDLRFAVFDATEPNQKMKGMVLANCLVIGKDGEADVPFTSGRFFLDISSGGDSYAEDDSPNIIVEGLTYRAGSKNVDQIPQMRGTRQYELRADAWTWDAGQGAYKTDLIDVSPSMFMPSLFPTEVVKWVLADVKDSGVSKPVGAIWATRTSTGVYQLWHNFAAVPTRMIFEASWDYRDTRKVTVGSNATVGSTHTQMIYSHGAAWSDVTGKPTTLEGYGITDAVGLTGDQSIAGVKTFTDEVDLEGETYAVDGASGFHLYSAGDITKFVNFNLSGISTGTIRTLTAPNLSGTLALLEGTQTVTGDKTFSGSNTFSGAVSILDSNLSIKNNSDNTKVAQFEASSITTDTTRTFTLPDISGVLAILSGTQTFSGDKTFTGAVNVTDGNLSIKGSSDSTKVAKFEVDGLTTATTRTLTVPDASGTLALTSQLARPYVIPAAGDYMMTTTFGSSGANGTLSGLADRMDLFQFIPPVDMSIDQIACNVTGGVASAQGKIIVYSADASNGRPNALLTESAALDFSSAATRTHSWSATLLQGVTYWFGMRHSSTATLSSWTTAAIPDINGGSAIATTARKILRQTLAFATSAPSTWTWSSGDISTPNAVALWLRKA